MALSDAALLGSPRLAAPRLDPGRLAGTHSAMQAMDRLPGCPPLHRHPVKRAFDVVGALGLLAIFGPLMLVVAWMVARDGGPAVFGHRRVGADGRPFTCLKFRSMVVDSNTALERLLAGDEAARAEWLATRKLRNDPRVTPVGRFLRRSSLDELPQLLNVLRGDMSLVGPRPIIDDEVPYYRACFPFYTRCRPGLTGLWQVSGRSDVDYVRRVQLDTAYVVGWDFWTDIAIMLRTVRVMVKGSGAY